jgi:hypothetical protein
MADNTIMKLFGFQLSKTTGIKKEQLPSIVPPLDDDGAGYVTASGSHWGDSMLILTVIILKMPLN